MNLEGWVGKEFLLFFGVKESKWTRWQCNGVNRSNGEWILFIDDDCIADKGYINAYYNAILQSPGIVLYEGMIYPQTKKNLGRMLPETPMVECFGQATYVLKRALFMK